MLVEEQRLTAKPAVVTWEQTGALFVAGTTAYAAVRAVGLTGGDTVAVSGATGGVGSSKVDAFIDTFGADYVQLAIKLGVEPSRIETVANFEAAAQYGVNDDGNAAGATASVLAELAGLIAAGELELPIAATFPLDRVQDAYRRLAEGHVLGKIVLLP